MHTTLSWRRGVVSSRPFYTTIFIITLLATYSIFIRGPTVSSRAPPSLTPRSGEECRLVHDAPDKCAFRAQPVAFIILALWLGLLFTTIGIAASDFFSVNLSTIATVLGLSESLAGVTFLALGNGSPDVFSTFAAMSSNSGSMAIGELIGAAGFITSVVAGSMALVREFRVSRKTFVRDICFFIAAVSFAMGFLADGYLHLWECASMIAFYIFYVIVVVGWHAVVKRRKARRAKEAQSRGHFYATANEHGDDALEPYRDDPDDEDVPPAERRISWRSGSDISALERGPRIEVGSPDDDDGDHSQHVAAEVTSSMRVNRPRGRRSNTTTITPIRPSLVGALEFSNSAELLQAGNPIVRGNKSVQTIQSVKDASVVVRNRSRSSGAVPITIDVDLAPQESSGDKGRAPSPHTIGGKLAPPPNNLLGGDFAEGSASEDFSQKPQLHRLRIPSPPRDNERSSRRSSRSSPSLSPFPSFTESPFMTTESSHQPPHMMLPSSMEERNASLLETETPDDDSEGSVVEQLASEQLGNAVPVSSAPLEPGFSIQPETEWQSDGQIIDVQTDDGQGSDQPQTRPVFVPSEIHISKPASEPEQTSSTLSEEEQGWNRWLLILQVFTGPIFCVLIVWANMAEDLDQPFTVLWKALLISLACSVAILGLILLFTSSDHRPKYHFLFCFLGFCISIAWISTIAGEVVGVLKAFGVILDISEAILGLTIFAVGNSVGDLVADVTVARLGYPVMALSACFGGPLLNILLGIGLGGAYQLIDAAKDRKITHPEDPILYEPYHIQVSGTLMISAITLLFTLLALLAVVPMNRWMMNKKIGWSLIGLWSVSTVVNLAIEVTGVWQEIA
ncbi:hypothetical protein ABKA04_006805 [Annulohypoxylon sp. FPYF3050]